MTRLVVVAVLSATALLALVLLDRVNDDSVQVITERHEAADIPIPTRRHETPPPTIPPGVATTTTTTTVVKQRPARTVDGATYPTDELLYALAMCETGRTMDQHAYNPAGPYLSYFQWLQGTWWSVGGEGDPRDHPYEVQRDLARTLILQAGWSQFPHCSRVIGAL